MSFSPGQQELGSVWTWPCGIEVLLFPMRCCRIILLFFFKWITREQEIIMCYLHTVAPGAAVAICASVVQMQCNLYPLCWSTSDHAGQEKPGPLHVKVKEVRSENFNRVFFHPWNFSYTCLYLPYKPVSSSWETAGLQYPSVTKVAA